MKVIFMGTPTFAIPILSALCELHTITSVVTQPDKTMGRGRRIQPSPVKIFAAEKGIPVFQPLKLRAPENLEILQQWEADVIVVAAYGQILPSSILTMHRFGCVNVHA
jgi:methionyl-tRNA formyltransferase